MRKLLILLILLAASCTNSALAPATAPAGESAQVTRIIDGDTIDVQIDGVGYRVRYIGMNTPERDEACYQQATDANAALVERQDGDAGQGRERDRRLRAAAALRLRRATSSSTLCWCATAGRRTPNTRPIPPTPPEFRQLEAEARDRRISAVTRPGSSTTAATRGSVQLSAVSNRLLYFMQRHQGY